MIKIGDKVRNIFNMKQFGIVTEIKEVPHKQMLTGGSFMSKQVARISSKDGVVFEIPVGDLMKE